MLLFELPRRNKNVTGISCGGIHNAAYTDAGQVFTWGCSDDGSLGRCVACELLWLSLVSMCCFYVGWVAVNPSCNLSNFFVLNTDPERKACPCSWR